MHSLQAAWMNFFVLTLNRPAVMNCFNRELLHRLSNVVSEVSFDDQLRCLIITGVRGDNEGMRQAFSARADLKERKSLNVNEVRRFIAKIRDAFSLVKHVRMPVIAAINGYAFDGGLELALACHIRIAAANGRTAKDGDREFARPGIKPRKEKLGETSDQIWPGEWEPLPHAPADYKPLQSNHSL